jgi:hypothetical protein
VIASLRTAVAAVLIIIAAAQPVAAQWTRVTEIPAVDMFSVSVNGDTITAGGDTAAYVSTNAGVTWKSSAKITSGVGVVAAVRMRNGRLYAGTGGQGVFISDNLGDTWTAFNQGLTGGFANSQLDIVDLLFRGDSLYAATSGAGVYVRNLNAGTWSHFGEVFEPNQASNMDAIAAGNGRLLALGGDNGMAFFRDPGQPDWTLSFLNNVGLAPGVQGRSVIWNGNRWLVGTNTGVFTSPLGESPWTFQNIGLGPLSNVAFALRGHDVFASFVFVSPGTGLNSTTGLSRDDGTTWQLFENQPAVFTFKIAELGNTLYASRLDGLWRRSVANVSVPPHDSRLRFAIAGAQPVHDAVRFRFEMPVSGRAAIDVYDLAGRRVSAPVQGELTAGPQEIAWNASDLPPGVYHALLRIGSRTEAVRLVRVR